ncbi:MAG: formylglycine-generating enzyme family protein [Planctomycetota bacterium]|jgi:formylglycine-generating enzyme required for sulfatase activity|nr:formylglycine-generating enzyme family protein [Planctomycetaceae bacterium]
MSRHLSVFLPSLMIIGMMQLGCQERAQSPQTITNGIGMEMVLIKQGNFIMGSPKTEFGDGGKHLEDESPQHEVRISRDFYMGQTEVTQVQWKAIMGTEPWKGKENVKEGDNYPASYISWTQAGEFCQRLSKQEEKQGRKYRLPTEAEWEYACRAGTKTKYSCGDDDGTLSEYAWFDANAKNAGESYAHEVGRKKANGYGLHDMHGNVSEWCTDLYDPKYYANSAKVDPLASTSSRKGRVTRGGNWFGTKGFCRSAVRDGENLPYALSAALGFRVVLLD